VTDILKVFYEQLPTVRKRDDPQYIKKLVSLTIETLEVLAAGTQDKKSVTLHLTTSSVSMCLTLRRLYVEEMESIRDTVAV
jgi:hypothetical protein